MMRLAAMLVMIGTLSVAWSQDCKLRKDKDGIKVYACHQDTSAFKQLRAEFSIPNASRMELLTFLEHVEDYPKWQYNMMEAEVLKPLKPHSLIYRSLVDAPWPVSNREMVVEFNGQMNDEEKTLIIQVKSSSYPHPKTDDAVRIPYSFAQWSVIETEDHTLQVSYVMTVDPGGSVPAWLLNMAIAEAPFVSFRNLRVQLDKGK